MYGKPTMSRLSKLIVAIINSIQPEKIKNSFITLKLKTCLIKENTNNMIPLAIVAQTNPISSKGGEYLELISIFNSQYPIGIKIPAKQYFLKIGNKTINAKTTAKTSKKIKS